LIHFEHSPFRSGRLQLKAKLGKLEGDPRVFAAAIIGNGFRELVISARHACNLLIFLSSQLPIFYP
jgi:hypothetical protein